MSYIDDYNTRLHQMGKTHQDRVQSLRGHSFRAYLAKSVYTVDIIVGDQRILCSFEPYKQDEVKTLHYLLTDANVELASGTYAEIPNYGTWMILYKENYRSTGYNRYILIYTDSEINWTDSQGSHKAYGAVYGSAGANLTESLQNSRSQTRFTEGLYSYHMVTTYDASLMKDTLITVSHIINNQSVTTYYRVTGIDIETHPGLMYVTLNDEAADDSKGKENPEGSGDDHFWFGGNS